MSRHQAGSGHGKDVGKERMQSLRCKECEGERKCMHGKEPICGGAGRKIRQGTGIRLVDYISPSPCGMQRNYLENTAIYIYIIISYRRLQLRYFSTTVPTIKACLIGDLDILNLRCLITQ